MLSAIYGRHKGTDGTCFYCMGTGEIEISPKERRLQLMALINGLGVTPDKLPVGKWRCPICTGSVSVFLNATEDARG